MSHFRELVHKYILCQGSAIRKICRPLRDGLGIPHFSYFRIEENGCFGNLTNCLEEMDFHYSQGLHLKYPYLVHPALLRSGCVLTTVGGSPNDSNILFERFGIYHALIIFKHFRDILEAFAFVPDGKDPHTQLLLYSKLDMMETFCLYFKREAKALITRMMKEGYDLKEARGEEFFKVTPSLPLSNRDPHILSFLKTVSPLSYRERHCLQLFKQGHSAQATAVLLGLSQRTVEHYLDSVKDKLGCSSK